MKKRALSLILALVLVVGLLPTVALAGDVTEIATVADLQQFAADVNVGKSYADEVVRLTNNIDLSGIEWTPIGTEANPFKGTFDGNGKTISNLTINSDAAYIGLFGYVASNSKTEAATICNLTLDGVKIACKSTDTSVCIGALAGQLCRVFVANVLVKNVEITANKRTALTEIGGVAGDSSCVVVSASGAEDVVIDYGGSGSTYLGGFTGYVNGHSSYWTVEGAMINSHFTDCFTKNVGIYSGQADTNGKAAREGGFAVGCTSYNGSHNTYIDCDVENVTIKCFGSGQHIAGGFMAYNRGMGNDSGCTVTGSISSLGKNESSIFGGFIGEQSGRGRTHSNHTVDVDIDVKNGFAGGFVGKTAQYLLAKDHANHYVFENCAASGDVTNTNGIAGGFAGEVGCYGGDGHQVWVDFTNCDASGDVTGDVAAGFLGSIASNSADFTDESRSGVTLTDCDAHGDVTGTTAAAGLIANIKNKNAKNDISTPVAVDADSTYSPVVTGADSNTKVGASILFDDICDESNIENASTEGTRREDEKVSEETPDDIAGLIAVLDDVPFVDVFATHYFYDSVKWAYHAGVTGGTDAWHFSPDDGCTRAQIVTFLWRAAGCPSATYLGNFTDVDSNAYYATAVAWAIENGITNGTSATTFSPEAVCTRADAVTFLYRAFGRNPNYAVNFSDVPANAYYADAVAWAAENGVTGGTGNGKFSPNDTCSRAQIVTFLYRTLG